MTRENEDDPKNAGCKFLKEIEKLKFNDCKKMIFTSDE